MRKFIDLSGKKVGMLTVIRPEGRRQGQLAFLCKCECGNEAIVRGDKLRQGKAMSCGCMHKKVMDTIGERRTLTYTIDGRVYTIKQICEECGISATTFYRHLISGETVEEVYKKLKAKRETPPGEKKCKSTKSAKVQVSDQE